MAGISPRKSEVEAVLAVLEPNGTSHLDPEEYDEAVDLAGDLLKACALILQERDWYLIAHQVTDEWIPGRPAVLYGIQPSESTATKWGNAIGLGSFKTAVVHSVGQFEQRNAKAEAEAVTKFGDIPCTACGHLSWHHGAKKTSRGKAINVPIPKGSARCHTRCECAAYTQEPKKAGTA